MKTKRLFWMALALALIITPIFAQTTQVFAPFVSELQGEIRNGLIRLSWIDSPDIKGPVYVYRSTSPFENAGALQESGAKPVEIPYGIQSHVYEIETGGTFYFFAVASDETGRSYEIPIVSSNTISVQIASESSIPARTSPPVVVEVIVPEKAPSPPAGISALEASAQGDRIMITFNPGTVKSAALYRSIRPINQTQDLLGAVILQPGLTPPLPITLFRAFPIIMRLFRRMILSRGQLK